MVHEGSGHDRTMGVLLSVALHAKVIGTELRLRFGGCSCGGEYYWPRSPARCWIVNFIGREGEPSLSMKAPPCFAGPDLVLDRAKTSFWSLSSIPGA